MNPIIRTENLHKSFPYATVLQDLSLEIPAGCVYALAGPNGSGKTALIRILMNLMTPTAGRAEVLGVDTRRLTPTELAQIGYVSEAQRMPLWMTAGRLLDWLKPLYPTWDETLAAALLRRLDVPENLHLNALTYSKKVKTAFITALAYRPSLLILDGPFSGLDLLAREELIELLREQAGHTSIFLASQDLGDIECLASHFGYLADGRLRFSGEMATLSALHREVEVHCDSPGQIAWPASWLNPVFESGRLRFTHQHWSGEESEREIAELLPAVRRVDVRPAGLRSIFLSLARSSHYAS